jgi:hypothetical protein
VELATETLWCSGGQTPRLGLGVLLVSEGLDGE